MNQEKISGRLSGTVQLVSTLSPAEEERMFSLLATYFAHTTRQRFATDLAEKEWVILMREEQTGIIQGFSTLMQMTEEFAGGPVTIFFSGDTIIHRDFWGETVLPKLWSRHVFSLAAARPEQKAYWFLICSGYKTYRFLPVFFREFYPDYRSPTPPQLQALIDRLGRHKHGDEYDANRGVVTFKEPSPLREGVAEITTQRLADPHVAFFRQVNPGHDLGDELACLTEISPCNVTAAGKRMIGRVGLTA